MAREFTATTHRLLSLYAALSGQAGPWTLSCWWRPANLTQSACALLQANSSGALRHGLRWESVADSVDFTAVSYTGTDPSTSSAIGLTADDVADGAWIAYRYAGAGGEWSKWKNGSKTVINAAITFALASVSAELYAGRNAGTGTNSALGAIAEIAIWHAALSDAELAELHRGVAADHIARGALQFYLPCRGTFSPERNWIDAAGTTWATVTGAVAATHPRIIGKPLHPKHSPAWVLDLFHADGTVKMASRDLWEEIDVDILGDFYPGDIRSPESVEVRDELTDGAYGVQVPQSSVVLVKPGPDYRDVVMEDGPAAYWRLGETSGSFLDQTENNNDGTIAGSGSTRGVVGAIASDPNGALRLPDAATDYVSVPHSTSLNLTAAVTVEAWIRTTGTNDGGIIEKTIGDAVNKQYLLFVNGFTLTFRCVKATTWYSVTTTIAANTWYHVVGRYDGAQVRMWVNGVEVGTPVALTGSLDSGNGITVIGRLGGSIWGWSGELDEMAVYPAALSEDRIRLHYRVGLQAWKGKIGHIREWRGVPARLRRYDRETHELTDEMHGVVQDVDYAGTSITIGTDDAVLDTPIPRQVIGADDFPSATDLGACIPVPGGSTAFMAPPYCGRDDEPEGRDFLIGWQHDADGNVMPIKVEKIWEDVSSEPGLELLTEWENLATISGATVTYNATNKISIGSMDLTYLLPAGLPIRYKDTAGGSNWQYTYVVSVDLVLGVYLITVADAELDSGLNNVEIQANGYLIEKARYSLLAKDLVSIRRFDGDAGSPVVQVSNPALANPATLIDEILRNGQWGLAQSVDAASVAAAETALSAASLGSAVSGVLGWNKQQRRARDVLRDLCSMRGIRLVRDASTGEWSINVDAAPSAAVYTLGHGDGQWNNVTRVRSIRRRSLAEAVQTLRFRFGLKATTSVADGLSGSLALVPERYQFYVDANCLDVGKTVETTNPYIANASVARRVAYYQAQNLKHSDLGIEIDGAQEMRLLRPGDLVRFVDPVHGLDATYRVWRTAKRLHEVSVLLRGYAAAMFTFDGNEVTNPTDTTDRDERATTPGSGTNLLYNPDFSIGPVVQDTVGVAEAIPGWSAVFSGTDLTSLATTSDPNTVSNASYLTAVVASNDTLSPLLEHRPINVENEVGRQIIASVYCDRADGWRFGFYFTDSGDNIVGTDAVKEPPLRLAGGAVSRSGLGYRRYCAISQVPATAVALRLWLLMDRATGTFNFDSAQLEFAGRRSHRPTEWKRHPRFGIDPAQLQAGTVTFRPSGQPEGGMRLVHDTQVVTGFGTGTTKDFATNIPAGARLVALAGRINTAIAGPTTINVGLASDATRFASGLSPSAGTDWNDDNHNGSHDPMAKTVGTTTVRFTAVGGNFSGAGTIRLQYSYWLNIAPTT